MTSRKHDWEKYKTDFFNSEIDDVVRFFASMTPPMKKTQWDKQARGWKDEKQAYKKQQAEAARAKAASDPEVQDLTMQLVKGKANALKIILAKIIKEKDTLPMKDLGVAVDLLRRELGEVGTISENKNDNRNELVLGEDFNRLVEGYLKTIS